MNIARVRRHYAAAKKRAAAKLGNGDEAKRRNKAERLLGTTAPKGKSTPKKKEGMDLLTLRAKKTGR